MTTDLPTSEGAVETAKGTGVTATLPALETVRGESFKAAALPTIYFQKNKKDFEKIFKKLHKENDKKYNKKLDKNIGGV